MFVVRKIISSKFKHNGQNIWQKLGWVSLHSQTSIRTDYNELRLGRAQLIKMVHTVMKTLMFRRWVIDNKKYLQGDAMDVAYDFINDSRTKMAVPSVVRVDWEGLAVAVPSFSRVSGELPGGAGLHGPGPTTVYQKISWHRLQDQDTRLCIHSNSSKMRARQPVLEPHSLCSVKKAKRLVGNDSLMALVNSNSGC